MTPRLVLDLSTEGGAPRVAFGGGTHLFAADADAYAFVAGLLVTDPRLSPVVRLDGVLVSLEGVR